MSAAQLTILLADSNERSRRLLDLALRKEGLAVTAVGTPTELAGAPTPDVILVDVAGGSEDLLDAIRRTPALAARPFVAIANPNDGEESARAAGARDVIARPPKAREVAARLREVAIARQGLPVEGPERVGLIEHEPLLDLLNELVLNSTTGAIRVQDGGLTGTIYFDGGDIIDAVCGRAVGQAALRRLLALTRGAFTVIEVPDTGRTRSISVDAPEAIEEAEAWAERFQQAGAAAGDLDAVYVLEFKSFVAKSGDLPPEVNFLVRVFDGQRTLRDAVFAAEMDDLEALELIPRLLQIQALVPASPTRSTPVDDGFETLRFTGRLAAIVPGDAAREAVRREDVEAARRAADEQNRVAAERARLEQERQAAEEAARVAAEQAQAAAENAARVAAAELEKARATAAAAEEAARLAALEASRRAEEAARIAEESRRREEEERQLRAAEEARRRAEEEARRRAEEDARRAAEDARRRVEEEARRRAEDEARRAAEEELRRLESEQAALQADVEAERQRALAAADAIAQAKAKEIAALQERVATTRRRLTGALPAVAAPESFEAARAAERAAMGAAAPAVFPPLSPTLEAERQAELAAIRGSGPDVGATMGLSAVAVATGAAAAAAQPGAGNATLAQQPALTMPPADAHHVAPAADAHHVPAADPHHVSATDAGVVLAAAAAATAAPAAASAPAEIPAPAALEDKFFTSEHGTVVEDDPFAESERSGPNSTVWAIGVVLLLIAIVAFVISRDETPAPTTEPAPAPEVAAPTPTPEPEPVPEPPPGPTPEELAAAERATAEADVRNEATLLASDLVAAIRENASLLIPFEAPELPAEPAEARDPERDAARAAEREARRAEREREERAASEPAADGDGERASRACSSAFSAGNYQQTISLCEEAARVDGNNAINFIYLGQAHYELGNSSQAVTYLERALRLDRRNRNAWLALGTARQDLGDAGGAREAYETYLQLNPTGQRADEVRRILESL